MVKKIDATIEMLKKAIEILTFVSTGYTKALEIAGKLSHVFFKILKVVIIFALGGAVVLGIKKIVDKIREKKEKKKEKKQAE